MLKKSLIFVGFCLVALSLAAQSGSIKSLSGKVELQKAGGAWVAAKVGDSVAKGTVVSVGFKSGAVIVTADATITVKALTRLSFADIVKTEGGTKTELYLTAGRVRTEVKPPSGQISDFKVKSPTATASVRGTGFEFDGVNLYVDHGRVRLNSSGGRGRLVGAGYAAFISLNNDVTIPVLAGAGGSIDPALLRQESGQGGEGLRRPFFREPSEPPIEPGSGSLVISLE